MKRWETALLLALVLTLLVGIATANNRVNSTALPEQQTYAWWTVAFQQEESEQEEYILRCRVYELWKQLQSKICEKR